MRRVKLAVLTVCLAAVLTVAGCVITKDEKGVKHYTADPNAIAKVESGATATISVLTMLGSIFPQLIGTGIITILASILATWRIIKPKLVAEQTRASLYYNTTASIVQAIEDFKELSPADWAKVEVIFKDKLGPEAVNVIRALRGLPAIT